MVKHPLSGRVGWRSVWRLLLALSALLVAAWSVGASDRGLWVRTAAAGPVVSPAMPTDIGGAPAASDMRAVASRPAVWAPDAATSVIPASVEAGALTATSVPEDRSSQAVSSERNSGRTAEFDGLSIVLAVVALLVLVSRRRRDQVLR